MNARSTTRCLGMLTRTALLLGLLLNSVTGWAQIYFHNFGTTTISGNPYSVAPSTLDANLSSSSWATSAASFTTFVGNGGTPSQALSLNNSGGTPTYTLSFNVASGYELSVTSFNFWRQ